MGARLTALAALCCVTLVFTFIAHAVYEFARDSFVAPTILSAQSEVVIANRLKLTELEVERARAAAEIEGIDADLAGADKAIGRLEDLQRTAGDALNWTSTVTQQKAEESAAELKALASQKRVIIGLRSEQRKLAEKAQKDMEAGLISSSDYSRQQQALGQLELALLENDRATFQSEAVMQETNLAQQALSLGSGTPQMPELIARQEQMIRVELEIVRLDSEKRAKLAQRKALGERLAKIDEMTAQIKSRPTFQAVEKNFEVAFVPYTQLDGVTAGAEVYSCVWGLFFCRSVGVVSELLPGEAVAADPWGNPGRGQYALLDLRDHEAARSKTLRIRSWANHARTTSVTVLVSSPSPKVDTSGGPEAKTQESAR